MILRPGLTKCPQCRNALYATDDIFAVKDWVNSTTRINLVPGIYHYDCFLKANFRDSYLAHNKEMTLRYLIEKKKSWFLIGIHDEFSLVYKPLADDYTLYFHNHGREITFYKKEIFFIFKDWILTEGQDIPVHTEKAIGARITYNGEILQLEMKEPSEISTIVSQADYVKIRKFICPEENNLKGQFLDIPYLQSKLKIQTKVTDCPFKMARGTITREVTIPRSQSVQIYFDVNRVKKIFLSFNEFQNLKKFISDLHSDIVLLQNQ